MDGAERQIHIVAQAASQLLVPVKERLLWHQFRRMGVVEATSADEHAKEVRTVIVAVNMDIVAAALRTAPQAANPASGLALR
jgi:hypothetical protein